jgi:hypothetical protein
LENPLSQVKKIEGDNGERANLMEKEMEQVVVKSGGAQQL